MTIIKRIERRVSLPGDSETFRTQKALSVILLVAGTALTVINLVTYLTLGITASAMILIVWILFMLTAALLLLIFPRLWFPLAVTVTLALMTVALTTLVFSGGFQAGLESAVWLLLGPISAALFIGRRFTIITLFFYIIFVITAVLLDPFAQSVAPQIPQGARLQIAAGNLFMMGIVATSAILYLLGQVDHYRRRADTLLHNMLPVTIASRLKESSETIADGYDAATILFADIIGSTPLFATLEPAEAVDWLNEVFSMFDHLVEKYGLEKIRTIGDNYMVTSGVPVPREDHAQVMTLLALDMMAGLKDIPVRHGKRMEFRIGINSGPLIAGVIGRSKYQYDVWGDAVNIASRMESHSLPGKVHIGKATYELIKDDFECERRGVIPIKGKGEMETWFVLARKA